MDLNSAPGRPRTRPWWLLSLVAGSALSVLALVLPAGSTPAAIAYFSVALLLAVATAVGVRMHRQRTAVRRLMTATWTISAAAAAWWSFYPLATGREMPFPSPADALFLVTDFVLVAALVAVARQGRTRGARGASIDALLATIAVGTISWAFLIHPLLAAETRTLEERLVPIGYTLLDLVIVGVLLSVWFLQGGRRPAHLLLAAGMAFHVAGNESFAASVLSDQSAFGQWYDPLYLVSWNLLAAGVLHPSLRGFGGPTAGREHMLTRGRLALLAAATLLPPTVIVLELKLVGALEQDARLVLLGVSALMSLLVLERMRGLVVDISQHREMQRLKNEFTSVVSHELRTPLTSIRGSLGLMAGGALGDMPPQAQRMLDIAVSNTDRLIRLINDILDLERIESGDVSMQVGPCAAGDIVREAVRELEGMASQAGIRLEATGSELTVSGDRDRLIQTLINLIGNAIKFSPTGALVSVSVERSGDEAIFRVEDQGRGIPADKLEPIFQAFEQVDASDSREKSGTGLGLAISRMIVERHGGRIWVESQVGVGSTFAFTIPAAAATATAAPSGPTVLLCDDDDALREVLTTTLTRRGYRVIGASSGDAAVRLALEERPAVVLLDLMMPGFSGWETVAALRRRPETQAIPIVILSVQAPEADHGVDGWLEKPVEPSCLFAALESALHADVDDMRVLVVEDDADLAAVLVERLSARGVTALHVGSVEAAIRSAAGTRPDVLVLDLGLPDGDGVEVLEALRRHDGLRSVPTVVYTARDVLEPERRRLQLGETEILAKGRITVEHFERRVLDLLARVAHGDRDRDGAGRG
jgi:signal transduction histidine kinase/CheY-like chemotaxis protein